MVEWRGRAGEGQKLETRSSHLLEKEIRHHSLNDRRKRLEWQQRIP
jgi:hypothetical protein